MIRFPRTMHAGRPSGVAWLATIAAAAMMATGCATTTPGAGDAPSVRLALDEFCLEAQAFVVRTSIRPALIVHGDFDAFVSSKALIEPLSIQQYVWYENDAGRDPVMISCKLKGADHLNETFGAGTAGPHRLCQDFNARIDAELRRRAGAAGLAPVVFDAGEAVVNSKEPGMTGPDWLAPYEMTWRDAAGTLHVRSKGFRVDWLDPRYQRMPARFRGVQYCHFIAPDYLRRLLTGDAQPGIVVGRRIATNRGAPDNGSAAPGSPAGR
jgi:hypothetical protein